MNNSDSFDDLDLDLSDIPVQSLTKTSANEDLVVVSKASKMDRAEVKERAEQKQLEDLRLLNTNFVFMFGDAASGKSAIFSSLMYYMSATPTIGTISNLGLGSPERKNFTQQAIRYMAQKQFLPATRTNYVNLAGGVFKPAANPHVKDHLKSVSLTFMEMSGEDLSSIVIDDDERNFPKHIDLYLGDPELKLTFVLVVSHDTIKHDKDLLFSEFIHFVRDRDDRFKETGFLLLISKWDIYKNDLSEQEFIQKHMPLTYAQLSVNSSAMASYSVGKTATNTDDERFIVTLDEKSPRRVLRWLYKTITGVDFLQPAPPESRWKVFLRKFGS